MCEQSLRIKFKYEGMKTAGVVDYTSQTPTKHFKWIKYLCPTDLKIRKYLSNVHKIGECMNIHHAKFEY